MFHMKSLVGSVGRNTGHARAHFGLHWRRLDRADISYIRVGDFIPRFNFPEVCNAASTWY
jgi:hypothetical protein